MRVLSPAGNLGGPASEWPADTDRGVPLLKALVARDYGPLEDLAVEDVPVPVPAPGQLLVRTEAVALNPADTVPIAAEYGFDDVRQAVIDFPRRHLRGKAVVVFPPSPTLRSEGSLRA